MNSNIPSLQTEPSISNNAALVAESTVEALKAHYETPELATYGRMVQMTMTMGGSQVLNEGGLTG